MRPAALCMAGTYRVLPGADACASAIGNTGVDVVSSPWLVGVIEEASHRLVRDLYDPGEGTVGVHLDVAHLAAGLPGAEITAHARLIGVDGRRLRFEVEAFQQQRVLMRGTHERVLVRVDRFMSSAGTVNGPAPARSSGAATGSPIQFFFDFHSPWCWFASLRIEALASRVGRPVVWRPMHLARLIERIDGRRPLEANPAFVHWFKQDMQDTAQALGLRLRYHPRFPLRPARALRAAVLAAERGSAATFVQAVMHAYWSDEGDIESLDLLADLAQRCGIDGAEVMKAAVDERYRQAVDANTEEAQAHGVFGAPSFLCDDKLFWGNDRMDRLEAWATRGLSFQ